MYDAKPRSSLHFAADGKIELSAHQNHIILYAIKLAPSNPSARYSSAIAIIMPDSSRKKTTSTTVSPKKGLIGTSPAKSSAANGQGSVGWTNEERGLLFAHVCRVGRRCGQRLSLVRVPSR